MEEGGQHDHDQLISATKALAGKLSKIFHSFCSILSVLLSIRIHFPFSLETSEKLNFAVDNHKNLKTIKGSDELVRKLKDLFSDFEEHEEKLRYEVLNRLLFSSIRTPELNM